MPSDITRRLEYWELKTEPEEVCRRLKQVRQTMVRRHAHQQVMLVEAETKARQVLNSAEVPTIFYPHYLNFCREVFARRQRFAGSSLAREIGVLVEKWVLRTLERAVLERIRDEAMSVPARPDRSGRIHRMLGGRTAGGQSGDGSAVRVQP
jgi:hypothetical protein